MKAYRLVVPAIAASLLLTAGVVSAQSGVSVGASPGTGNAPAGSQVNLGTLSITSPNGGSVTSVPVTFTASGGATLSQLSNCQLYNASGQTLNTGGNIVSSISSSPTTFTFNSPLGVSGTATTLTVRCDVASTIPSTGMFSYSIGTPTMSGTQQPVPQSAALAVNLDVAPSVPRGSNDVALANISLGAGTSSNASVTSVPITVTAGGGASLGHLSDCRVRNTANLSGSLSGSFSPSASGATTFSFASPHIVSLGGSTMLALTCDVSATAPIGGTFTVSIVPASVSATNASTGASITPQASTGTGPNGLPPSTSGTVIVTGTVSGGTGGTDNTGGTPGVPNTGLGGQMGVTLALLALAALVALGGGALLRRS